jgi:hypothetical protein
MFGDVGFSSGLRPRRAKRPNGREDFLESRADLTGPLARSRLGRERKSSRALLDGGFAFVRPGG